MKAMGQILVGPKCPDKWTHQKKGRPTSSQSVVRKLLNELTRLPRSVEEGGSNKRPAPPPEPQGNVQHISKPMGNEHSIPHPETPATGGDISDLSSHLSDHNQYIPMCLDDALSLGESHSVGVDEPPDPHIDLQMSFAPFSTGTAPQIEYFVPGQTEDDQKVNNADYNDPISESSHHTPLRGNTPEDTRDSMQVQLILCIPFLYSLKHVVTVLVFNLLS